MDLTSCSLCLLIISAVRKTNTQNWGNTPKSKHREQGFATVANLEFITAPFDSRQFESHTEQYKQAKHHTEHLIAQNLPSERVTVICSDYRLRVQVRKDFLGPSAPQLTSAELSLGGTCKSNGGTRDTIVFHYNLHNCGSERTVTDKELVYSNFLLYTPSTGVPSQGRNITTVHCHYEREHIISSAGVKPTWIPKWMQRLIAGSLDFSLDVMSEDWQSKCNTSIYYLGQTINLQMSINPHNHMGFKIYVDSCVATTSQELGSEHSYYIIQDYGCLTDSMVAHSMAKFISPRSDSTLRFQIQAFQFKGHMNDLMFIHCTMKVDDNKEPPSDQSKSCQYNAETRSWDELDGRDSLCDCCETWSCGRSRRRTRNISPRQYRNNNATLGELVVGPLYVLLPVSTNDIRTWTPIRKSQWDTLSRSLEGMWGMTLEQLVTVCMSAMCTLCMLVGLLCLCLRCHPFPAHNPPSHLPRHEDVSL